MATSSNSTWPRGDCRECWGTAREWAALGPGDVLTLFSDGVTEENSPGGEEFGEDRLSRLLIERGRGGAANLVEEIRQTVLAWAAGAEAADDVTVVVAARAS